LEDWFRIGDNLIKIEVQTSSEEGIASMFIRYLSFEIYLGTNFSLQTKEDQPTDRQTDQQFDFFVVSV
jgi:hypothetical protein